MKKQKWKYKSFKEKVESIMGVFGGFPVYDILVLFTLVFVWAEIFVNYVHTPFNKLLLPIVFIVIGVSRLILILVHIEECEPIDNPKKDGK